MARHSSKQPPSLASRGLVLAAAGLLLLLAAPQVHAQRPYPLPGADADLPVRAPNANFTPFDINTSALLERVVKLEEQENAYTAIWWVIFSWFDARAGAAVAASTASQMRPGGNCSRPCDSGGLASMGCCDGIWLPHIELPNIMLYDSDQQPRWRINANASSGRVSWSTRLVGKWYAPLDYRAYPFDHQHLVLELALHDSMAPLAGLKWEHVAKLNNTAHTKGADLSGWRITWGKGKIYDSRTCYKRYGVAEPRYIAPANLTAGNASTLAVYESVTVSNRYFPDNHLQGTTEPPNCGTYKTMYDEGRAHYGPVVLVADFMIKRVSSYYVLTNLIPVLLITLVAFVVFFMPQSALGDRMSVVLTMFLSLTAMQFVFDFPPANYINALQMVVLVSYIMIALACVESLIVNRIATLADAIHNKRLCVRKYGAGLLSRAAFDRYLTRELMGSSMAAKRYGGGSGGGAVGRSAMRGAASGRGKVTLASGGASGGAAAGPAGPAGAATNGTRREDSALEHIVVGIPPSHGNTPIVVAPPRTPSRHARVTRIASTPASAAAASKRHGGGSTCGDSASVGGDGVAEIASLANDGPAAAAAAGHPPLSSPFASARTHVSFAVSHAPADDFGDARSVTSSKASTVLSMAQAGCQGMWRRCRALGFLRSMRAFFAAVGAWLVGVVTAPSHFYQQCKEDPAFATFVAARIDKWSCIVSVTLYIICISVLLWIEVKVGDHKLMLGDRPGNM